MSFASRLSAIIVLGLVVATVLGGCKTLRAKCDVEIPGQPGSEEIRKP